MSMKSPGNPVSEESLRSYNGPWKGELVLVCRKCQKKLKHRGGNQKLARLGKTLNKRARRHDRHLEISAVNVPCLKMCPKEGVTVCTGPQLARRECSVLRSLSDVDALINRCVAETKSQ
jgi:predicted metal-binding protein